MDEGITYPLLSSYYYYLRFGEEIPELIIVGISYGTDDWEKVNMRGRDYTAKSDERDFWSGAENFKEFLNNELFPLIENNYPADQDKRIIFDQSIGNWWTVCTLCCSSIPRAILGTYSNPAMHRNLKLFLNLKPISGKHAESLKLFVSCGSDDNEQFREPALKWMEFWGNQVGLPWKLKTITLAGQSHFSAAPEAFRHGLRWLFWSE